MPVCVGSYELGHHLLNLLGNKAKLGGGGLRRVYPIVRNGLQGKDILERLVACDCLDILFKPRVGGVEEGSGSHATRSINIAVNIKLLAWTGGANPHIAAIGI